jgi:hypothetical protein
MEMLLFVAHNVVLFLIQDLQWGESMGLMMSLLLVCAGPVNWEVIILALGDQVS